MAEQGGLLDFLQTPEGQGLLAAGFSGLANARRGAPLNTVGAAGLSGLMGYSGAQDRQRQQAQAQSTQEMNALQMQRLRRELEAPPAPTVYKPGDVVYQNGEMQFQVPKEPELPIAVREFEYAKQNGFKGSYEDFKKITNSTTPFTSPIATDRGYMGFNTRTGEITPLMDRAGNPLLPPAQSPTLQGQIARQKEEAEAGVKTKEAAKTAVSRSDVMLGQLDQAETLLKKNPTGSMAGAAVDTLGRSVGISSESAKTAAQLKAVSGWLVSNVPRMEGPQSNYDVQNYQQMAGMVGDPTVPVAERMAALQEVRRLQEKYRDLNQSKIDGDAKSNVMPEMPKAAPNNKGRVIRNEETGERYRSNGMSWEKL